MAKQFDSNLMTKFQVTISNNVLFTQQPNEYLKLVEIAVVSTLEFVEEERTFSTHAFMKDKLHNRLGLHLDTTICMFAQKFYTQESFPYQEATTAWKDQKVWIGVAAQQVLFFSQHKTRSIPCFVFP